ncbi:hypothetical protein GCM10023220_36230 [Streptomyces ziwulingensis]|uniref:Uncharacterized protein n=1 Tax=Streptomyces ziwulingensis TaxID=1045501 RepID=A0ABP9C1M6_9ACTN
MSDGCVRPRPAAVRPLCRETDIRRTPVLQGGFTLPSLSPGIVRQVSDARAARRVGAGPHVGGTPVTGPRGPATPDDGRPVQPTGRVACADTDRRRPDSAVRRRPPGAFPTPARSTGHGPGTHALRGRPPTPLQHRPPHFSTALSTQHQRTS